MASDENQDFSTDANPNNQLNKYGFSSMQNFPSPMYPSMPMPGYFPVPALNENPLQELQMMGFKEMSYTETTGTTLEPYGFELKLGGVDKVFTGLGVGKKKARKVAAQSALDHLYDSGVLPEGIRIKPQKNKPPFMHPMFPNMFAPMGQFPSGYPMRSMPQQYPSIVPAAPPTPQTRPPRKETPLSLLHDKYPEAQVRSQSTSIITIGEHEFSVTVPGNNSQESRMHASVAALKELEGLEFPEWDQRLDRIIQNHRDPSSMLLHPVTLLLREYGTRNVTFKHETLLEPCIVSINESGNIREYSSPVCSTKKQAKYEASMAAIRALDLDKKYTNILPSAQLDRKRKHTESEANANDDVTQLGYSIQTSMGIDEDQKQDSVPIVEVSVTQLAVPDETSLPELIKSEHESESEPIQDKKMRMDQSETPASDVGSESPSQETKQGPLTGRFSRAGGRRARVATRGYKGHIRGFRGSQRYF